MQWPRRRNRLQYWRKIRNYTQGDLGRKIRVSVTMISKWERDESNPRTRHAMEVSRILRVPVQELWPYEHYHEVVERTRKKERLGE